MIARSILPFCLLVVALLLSGCSTTEAEESTPVATATSVQEQPTATPEPTVTPSPTPDPTPTAAPTPTEVPEPTPTATPEPPLVSTVTETPCCGLFQWLDDDNLLVFDEVPDQGEGAWRVDVRTGDRQLIAEGFGLSSPAGVIAFPEPTQGRLVLRDFEGDDVSVLQRGIDVAWPSPDGSRVAWLENLAPRTPSSSVNRSVSLRVADTATGEGRTVLELQAAEVHWLPDNRRLLVPARDLEFEQAGLWIVDMESGTYEVIFQEIFVQAVRLSPDGGEAAFMRTFNADPEQNGIWTVDLETQQMQPLGVTGPYRWDAGGEHVWLLEMTSTGEANDRIHRIDVDTGERLDTILLEGQILNDAWEISPDGSYVAFWRESDGQVVAQELR